MTRKKGMQTSSIAKEITMGILAAVVAGLLCAALAALLMAKEIIAEDMAGGVGVGIHGIAALLGGLLAGKKCEGKMALVCGCAALGSYVIWVGVGMLFFEGLNENALWCLLSAVAGGMASCGILLFPKKTRNRFTRSYSR